MQPLRDLVGLVLAPGALVAALLVPDLPQTLPVEPYRDGVTPVFLDRPYVNTAPVAALAGHHVVRVPRHLRFAVELELAAPGRVLRLLSDENDNRPFSDWEPLPELALLVEGRSCVFTRAVAKHVPAGSQRLAPGGPVAAAPILVASEGAIRARTTSAWNKLTPGEGPLDFVLRNKRKLAGLTLVWLGLGWGYWRWRTRRA